MDAVIDVDDSEIPEPPENFSDIEKRATTRLLYAFVGNFHKYVTHWIRTAPLPDVLAWKTPSTADFIDEQALVPPVPTDRQRLYRWIHDRFTRTYLDDWADHSLLLEWRFMEGLQEPPCPVDAMVERTVQRQALATAIANRTAGQSPRDDTLESLKSTAVRFLREGRRASAVAVFEAARDLDQGDPEAHNNYGFCLLPDHPEEALASLERANEMGYRHKTGNAGNRILALHMLGRDAAALALAERVVDDWESQDRRRIYWLWDFNSIEQPRLLENTCASCYVVELAVKIAEKNGDPLRSRWQSTRAALIHR